MVFNDNRDNGNNGKNRRNGLCHEVTYNKDNGDYSAPDVFSYDNRGKNNRKTTYAAMATKTGSEGDRRSRCGAPLYSRR